MAQFNVTLTNNGAALLAKGVSGKTIQFQKMVMGDGSYSGSLSSVTAVVSPKKELAISKITRSGEIVILRSILLFQTVTEGFTWREIGLYALDPDTAATVLYAYGNAGSNGDYIPDASSTSLDEKIINLSAAVSTAGSVTATVDASMALAKESDLEAHVGNTDNPHGTTAAQAGAVAASLKGAAGGVAELDSGGKVPSSQLPSYVDDVLEYSSLSSFPSAGETGKIYVALDVNKTYRWSGSAYIEISASLALGETSSTAYRGDRGASAYTHSQTSGNPHGTTAAQVGALTDIVGDATPQLGGELDCQAHTIGFTEYDNGSSGTAKTVNWTLSNHQKVTMTGSCTFAFTTPSKPCMLSLRIIQDGTGSRTITLPTIKWPGGAAPTWSAAANAIDILSLYYDGSAYYGQAGIAFA